MTWTELRTFETLSVGCAQRPRLLETTHRQRLEVPSPPCLLASASDKTKAKVSRVPAPPHQTSKASPSTQALGPTTTLLLPAPSVLLHPLLHLVPLHPPPLLALLHLLLLLVDSGLALPPFPRNPTSSPVVACLHHNPLSLLRPTPSGLQTSFLRSLQSSQ